MRLGPAFIKLGQMLSSRPDLLPPAYIYQLQSLCDQVPHFDHQTALAIIEDELGAPATEMFIGLASVDRPIAAASLGQVYRCKLRSTGKWVALKVQRPDMLECVSLDLYLLRKYMQSVEALKHQLMRVGLMAQRAQF